MKVPPGVSRKGKHGLPHMQHPLFKYKVSGQKNYVKTKDGKADFNIAKGIESDIIRVSERSYFFIRFSYLAKNFLKVDINLTTE